MISRPRSGSPVRNRWRLGSGVAAGVSPAEGGWKRPLPTTACETQATPSVLQSSALQRQTRGLPYVHYVSVFRRRHTSRRRKSLRRGLTLVEMAISIVLVSVMLVAALSAVGAAEVGKRKVNDRRRGYQLAQELMAEILQQQYADGSVLEYLKTEILADGKKVDQTLGPETGEDTGDRSLFDDIDDYQGWLASPPQERDGTELDDLSGWQRKVTVNYVKDDDPRNLKTDDEGAKLITVTVTHGGALAAELTALRTIGPPPTEACCLADGTCVELSADVCSSAGGEPQGQGTDCYTADCYIGKRLLLVVKDDENPTGQEKDRRALIESWGFAVTLIDDSDAQEVFNAAVAEVDVAYVSEQVDAGKLATKLREAAVGVVNEDEDLVDDFGFASKTTSVSEQLVYVDDNTHHITSEFAAGWITAFSHAQPVYTLKGFAPPQYQVLIYTRTGGVNLYPSLMVLEEGWELYGGGTAAGRRVQLPWGRGGFDINKLTSDGQLIMQRAIEWAAKQE